MSRDSRRFSDPARSVTGECGSGERPVEVSRDAFDADIRWAEFDTLRAEVKLCAEDRATSKRRRRWLIGSLGISGGTLTGLLVWAVTKLDARADAAAEERMRIQTLMRLERDVRQLQLESAATQAVLGLRGTLIP